MAPTIQPKVKHVVGLDVSEGMLEKGQWQEFSVIKRDIGDLIFVNAFFDKLVARMVFHHIVDGLDRALLRCFDFLKCPGKLIVAEGVPASDAPDIVKWYTDMFRLKEIRRAFTPNELVQSLDQN